MTAVNECLILAAGNGSRIASVSGGVPKPLVRLRGIPLLEHVLTSCQEARITRFVIVVGYRADLIRRWFGQRPLDGISVTLIENPEYNKANGVSALAAIAELHNPFLLLMSDHIFEPKTAKALARQSLGDGEVILAVDHNVDRVLTSTTQQRSNAKRIRSSISAKILPVMTPSTQACFCAARHSSTGSNQQKETGAVRCRMVCANLRASRN